MKDKAREFALRAHANQQYGDLPYSVHLDDVANIAKNYGKTAEIVAYLHDVVEDTNVSLKQIEAEFGDFISSCVSILTDETGETRQLRKAATNQKMAQVEGDLTLALLVKAADRLANMRTSIKDQNHHYQTLYKSEYPAFKRAVYRLGLCDEIWAELDAMVDG